LKTVFRYYDAQTDDAALTRAVLTSATALGAEINYGCRFTRADCHAAGCSIEYRQNDEVRQIETHSLINATGPWVNKLLERVNPAPQQLGMELVQGTHLVIPGELSQGIYYLEAPQDRRAVFAMPWQQQILLGTTETPYSGDPAEVKPLEEEILYLLEVYRHYFDRDIKRSQLLGAFAGLRVLPRSEASAFHRSRDALLHVDSASCPRLLSIYGGKLTSYRLTAERVIERISGWLPQRKAVADTRTLKLP
jgi:glycerol-3-phosphate dehydrogenase